MSEQEELMDNILNVDLEIVETVRTLQQENWNTEAVSYTHLTLPTTPYV